MAAAPSLGLHESQSRMWENVIGRSRPYWEHYTPVMAEVLGDRCALRRPRTCTAG